MMRKRELEGETALVICVGKHCCKRDHSRAIVEAARVYAEKSQPSVKIVAVGCLDVCKKGPIAATYPKIKFKKRVTEEGARTLIDKLGAR